MVYLHKVFSHTIGVWLIVLAVCAIACSDDSDGGSDGSSNGASNGGTSSNGGTGTSNGSGTSNGGTGASNTSAACTDDASCGAGQGCDTDTGICRPACSADTDCDVTESCTDGLCVPGAACTDASQCTGAGQVCNTCSGRCERAAAAGNRTCSMDSNCFIEEFCDTCRGICRELGEPCEPCQEDQECGGSGDLCLDFEGGGRFCAAGCATTSDCDRGYACTQVGDQMQCLPRSGDCSSPGECVEDEECPAGQQCSPLLACVDGCTEGTCPNGEVCDSGSCKPPCTGDADCPEGAECQESGLCRIPGGCITSRDCLEPGTYCDEASQMCLPGCGDDDDCAGLQVCVNNACVRPPCDGNYRCGFGQVCDIPTGACVQPTGPYCDMCDAEAENQCGGEPNLCLRISDEDGNAVGDFCGVDCDPDDLDACPVGYGCQEVQDQNMETVGHVCFRSCHRDPV